MRLRKPKFRRPTGLRPPIPGPSVGAGLLIGMAGVLAGVLLERGPGASASTGAQHPVEWDGTRWVQFSPQAKDAYLGGFLAGAAASQAYAILESDTAFDPEALAERLATLRSEGALHFPFGANLYHARLHDYYFYVDRLERPLYRVMAELNFQLQRKHY